MEIMTTHCCDLMKNFLEEGRIGLGYNERFREYYFKLRDEKGIAQLIFHCPWCGKLLPLSLRDEYFDLLMREYGIEISLDIIKNSQLPPEFKSDEWWKKRNL